MQITDLFSDHTLIPKIQTRLPELFQLAELESSRAGRIGMEVGSARERIIIALLIYKFGSSNVETEISILEPEIDVNVAGSPISIKTITGKNLAGVKLIWTVDAEQAVKFRQEYIPRCDIILVQINWSATGWFYCFPRQIQQETINSIGRERYIKLPKVGTNPRGVEISAEALNVLANHPQSLKFPIKWERKQLQYNLYDRWLEYWKRD